MTASLFSARWYRVESLRPRLRTQVRVQRQHWRDQRWYLLSDAATGRQHRINEAAYQFIGRCDGRRSVREVWNALLEAQPDAAPTQDEVLDLLGQLGDLELLQADRAADGRALLQRHDDRQRRRQRRMLNPFSFRLPLGDAAPWLARLDPLAHALFRPRVFQLWLLPSKGWHADTIRWLRELPAFKAVYQLHRNLQGTAEENTPAEFIANLEEQPDEGNLIAVEVDAGKKTFTVTNSRTNVSQTYRLK